MNKKLLKVTDRKSLARDKISRAILHCDDDEYKKHKIERKKELTKEQRLNNIEEKLASILKLLENLNGSNSNK